MTRNGKAFADETAGDAFPRGALAFVTHCQAEPCVASDLRSAIRAIDNLHFSDSGHPDLNWRDSEELGTSEV
jgi:hypothetical protein